MNNGNLFALAGVLYPCVESLRMYEDADSSRLFCVALY